MNHNLNCLSYWLPKIQAIGIATPRTEIVTGITALDAWVYGEGDIAAVDADVARIRAASDAIGYPCFLRTGQTSAKHSWADSCHVPDAASVKRHVWEIAEFSHMCDFMGLPTSVWVARELLPTITAFYAFHDMPITREFRLFVREGEVCHIQPYWPPAAIRNHVSEQLYPDWRAHLREISRLDGNDLTSLRVMTEDIGRALGGWWSVDWLWTERGWYCTDMAQGADSYVWEPGEDEEGSA